MKYILLMIACIFSLGSQSQSISPELISTAGGQTSFQDIRFEWSVGETIVSSSPNGVIILTEGFHQANILITNVETFEKGVHISIYPNPTLSIMNIKLAEERNLSIQITDIQGQLVQSWSMNTIHKAYDCSHLLPGTYNISVSDNKSILLTSQLIKL